MARCAGTCQTVHKTEGPNRNGILDKRKRCQGPDTVFYGDHTAKSRLAPFHSFRRADNASPTKKNTDASIVGFNSLCQSPPTIVKTDNITQNVETRCL